MDIPRHPLTGCGQITPPPPLPSSNTLLPYLSASSLLALPRLITPPPPLLTTFIRWTLWSSSHGAPRLNKFGTKMCFCKSDYWPPCWTLFSQQLVLDIIPKKSSTVFQIYFLWLPSDSVCLMSDRFPPSHLCRPLSPTSLIENQSIAVTKIVYLPVFLIMSSCLSNYLSRYA